MNYDRAKLIKDCYDNDIDTGFVVDDKYFYLCRESIRLLKISDMMRNNTVSFEVETVSFDLCTSKSSCGWLLIGLEGDCTVSIFVEGIE